MRPSFVELLVLLSLIHTCITLVKATGTNNAVEIISESKSNDEETKNTSTHKPRRRKIRLQQHQNFKNKNDKDPRLDLECTYSPPPRRWYHRFILFKRHERMLTRRAYRLGVLAKLAYWDFRAIPDEIDHDDNGDRNKTANGKDGKNHDLNTRKKMYNFALRDDPSPSRQLLPLESPSELELKYEDRNKKDRLVEDMKKGNQKDRFPIVRTIQKIFQVKSPHIFIREMILRLRLSFCCIREQWTLHIMEYRKRRRLDHSNPSLVKARKAKSVATRMCKKKLLNRHNKGKKYQIEWTLQNWHESNIAKMKWHDTDLIIATSGESELVLSFAGTASVADQFTNAQTFETVTHSTLFSNWTHVNATNRISGSIHRGFLNAYSRVSNGNILRLCDSDTNAHVDNENNLLSSNQTVVDADTDTDDDGGRNEKGTNTKVNCQISLTQSLHRRYDEGIVAQNKMMKSSKRKSRMKINPNVYPEYFGNEEDVDFEDELESGMGIMEDGFDGLNDMNITTDADIDKETDDVEVEMDMDMNINMTDPVDKSNQIRHESNNNNTRATMKDDQTEQRPTRTRNSKKKKRKRQMPGYQSSDVKLMDLLREVVSDALHAGHDVYLTGHSQGAAIATLLALDVVINLEHVPITKLHLWTFGAPEVADSEFYESAMRASPRLRSVLQYDRSIREHRKRHHRFVTRSDNCDTDFVTSLVSKGLDRRPVKKLGGVRGNIIHAVEEPIYVPLRTEKSGLAGHHMSNYLKGISILMAEGGKDVSKRKEDKPKGSSSMHDDSSARMPLTTNFPPEMKEWIGEIDDNANYSINVTQNET